MNDLHSVFRAAPIYAIFDTHTHHDIPAHEVAAAWLRAGIRVIQYRHKTPWTRAQFDECTALCRIVRAAGGLSIVNDRADIALLCAASGVHVGQDDLPPDAVRTVVSDDCFSGCSTHNIEQVRSALAAPIDYLAVGPVYPTATKESPDPVVGLELVRLARAMTRLPLVAIGGIGRENAQEVLAAGADAVAVISGLVAGCRSKSELEARAREFLAAVRG